MHGAGSQIAAGGGKSYTDREEQTQQDELPSKEGVLSAACGGGFEAIEVLPNPAGAAPSPLCGVSR